MQGGVQSGLERRRLFGGLHPWGVSLCSPCVQGRTYRREELTVSPAAAQGETAVAGPGRLKGKAGTGHTFPLVLLYSLLFIPVH